MFSKDILCMCVFVSMNGSSKVQGGDHSREPPALGTSLLGGDDEHELTRLIFLPFQIPNSGMP